jgi:hypothetical protein
MSIETKVTLDARIQQIRSETEPLANTAARVGVALQNILDTIYAELANREAAGTAAGLITALKAGVPAAGDTLSELYTLIQSGGKSLLSGTVNPTSEGINGDFYINTATWFLFGPKAAGTWPAGISLIGPGGGGSSPLNGVDNYGSVSLGVDAVDFEDIVFHFGTNGYSPAAGSLPLDPANPDSDISRFDLLVANSDGSLSVIPGTEGTSATIPGFNPVTQLPIRTILINADGSSLPPGTEQPVKATQGEMNAGTDDAKFGTPLTINALIDAKIEEALDGLEPGSTGGLVAASGALALTTASETYVFTGSVATWTMPAVSGNTARPLRIFNKGSDELTLTGDMWNGGAISTYSLLPGDAVLFIGDGTHWLKFN